MSVPMVSVVMCTYNGERFLNDQIGSILQQDYPNFCLIVVDDCSTDTTWYLLQRWAAQDNRISIHRNTTNLGYNRNFQKAIGLANSPFISLADQDDIWLPTKISHTMRAFTRSDIMLAHCRSVRLQDGELKYHLARLHHHFSGSDSRRLFYFNQVMGHDAIFRQELVPYLLPIPTGMSYDWWIAVVATCYGSIAGVEAYLVHHRIHATNSFFSAQSASKKKELDLVDTLRLFAALPGMQATNKQFLQQLIRLLDRHNSTYPHRFNPHLFRFLYRYRRLLFGHKRRLFSELNLLKNAFKYARFDYRGKGISI